MERICTKLRAKWQSLKDENATAKVCRGVIFNYPNSIWLFRVCFVYLSRTMGDHRCCSLEHGELRDEVDGGELLSIRQMRLVAAAI